MDNNDLFIPKSEFERFPAQSFCDNLPEKPAIGFWKSVMLKLIHRPSTVLFFGVLMAIVLGSILVPLFWPFDYATQNVAFANKTVMSRDPTTGFPHVFGTDHLGRDIFIRIWYGARISLLVAAAVVVIDGVVGIVYGGIAGYMGGKTDTIMMRVVEVIKGVPYLLIVLLLVAVLPQGIGTMILAYSMVGWTGMARLVRGQVATLREQEFVLVAKAMGAGARRIIFQHLLPNMMGIIIVNITLDIPAVIFTEAFLSMLGMGVPPPYPSLGMMVNEGVAAFQIHPSQLMIPALFICLIMLTFNILGDRLQDALDPKLRRVSRYGRRAKTRKSTRDV